MLKTVADSQYIHLTVGDHLKNEHHYYRPNMNEFDICTNQYIEIIIRRKSLYVILSIRLNL